MTVNEFFGGVKGLLDTAGSTAAAIKNANVKQPSAAKTNTAWPAWATPVAIGVGALVVVAVVVAIFKK